MNNSIQFRMKEIRTTKNCIHMKHLYSLLDTPLNDENYKKLSKHLELCTACSQEYKDIQLKAIAAKIYIPKAMMDHDLRESFEREVTELFKVMDLNNRVLLKKKVKSGFNFIDRMGIDFIKSLTSNKMLKTYVIAAGIYLGLRFLFSN